MAKKDGNFTETERQRAARWKEETATLPDEARQPAPFVTQSGHERGGPYPFCLPPEFSELSLLPEVRAEALALFAELGIPWHSGVGDGPGNHLLSSQVQCVNALGQMVTDPDRLIRAFGPVVDTAEVLEIEPGRFLTFEYIGDTDYFGEGIGGARTRGSSCTSIDAAFLHRTTTGHTELILVEWKYTESYPKREPDTRKDHVRRGRYFDAFNAPDGPVRSDVLDFDDLLDEPLYQLMRQQLLAWKLERDHAHGGDRVRVVHVHPLANSTYQASLHRESQRAVGSSVHDVWQQLLRYRDRYVEMDNDTFLDPQITSDEYAARYGDTPIEEAQAG